MAIFAVSSGSAQAFSLVTTSIIARNLASDIYGIFVYLLTILSIARDGLNFQLYQVLVREIHRFKENGENILKANSFIEFCSGVIVAILAFCIILNLNFGSDTVDRQNYLLAAVFALLVIFSYVHRSFLGAFHALDKVNILGFFELIPNFVFFTTIVSVFYLTSENRFENIYLTLTTLVSLKLAGLLFAILIFSNLINQIFSDRTTGQWLSACPKLIRMSVFPMMAGWLSIIYYNTDRIMLFWLRDAMSVGIYHNGFLVGLIISFACATFVKVVYPRLSKSKFENTGFNDNKYLFFYNRLLIFVILPSCVLVFHFSELIITQLFGDSYTQSATILRIYLPFVFLNISVGPSLSILFLESKQKYLFYSLLAASLVNICFNYILIPEFGAEGATLATGMGILVNVILVHYKLLQIVRGVYAVNVKMYLYVLLVFFGYLISCRFVDLMGVYLLVLFGSTLLGLMLITHKFRGIE